MIETDFFHLAILFALAVVAATVDAMAGGGGLLTVPGLMATGLDPVTALATNKFQGTFGALSSTYRFWRSGKLSLKKYLPSALFAFAGGLAGAATVMVANPDTLKSIIPFLLIAIACWVLFSPKLGDVEAHAKIPFTLYIGFFVPFIGFYDGFLGPGAGSFYALSGVALLGLKLDEATARAKLYNLMSNFAPLLFFLAQGKIFWLFASVMAVGNIIGGQIGARLVIHHGTGLIRPILVIMSFAMSIKLLWQQGLLHKILPGIF
ncbi:MAG: TSUP family transporter [Alphaproteobacteria bacterium]|nr:TSUP family transporter [Alphaproteobacteria bacterium]